MTPPRTFGEALEQARPTDEQLSYLRNGEDYSLLDPKLLAALVRELIAFRTLPKHAQSCSNQNVVDPVGAYRGVEECGCNR